MLIWYFSLIHKDFERSLRKTIEEGDVDDIADKLTPRALTKCNTNALLMAMEVGDLHSIVKSIMFWPLRPRYQSLNFSGLFFFVVAFS